MANFEAGSGETRDELMQRVALMEAMIAEGRRSTAQYGWVFLLWGLVYVVAVGWGVFLPFANLAWPVCVAVGIVLSCVIRVRQRRRGGSGDLRARSIWAVWRSMGIAVTLFVIAAVVSHHANNPDYVAAILFFIGLAHGTSAMILRWPLQGVVAAIWWACGIASFFFTSTPELIGIFLAASFFGMIVFGLYVMMQERRRASVPEPRHA